MKEHKKLCQKQVSKVTLHFVWGHLTKKQTVSWLLEFQSVPQFIFQDQVGTCIKSFVKNQSNNAFCYGSPIDKNTHYWNGFRNILTSEELLAR